RRPITKRCAKPDTDHVCLGMAKDAKADLSAKRGHEPRIDLPSLRYGNRMKRPLGRKGQVMRVHPLAFINATFFVLCSINLPAMAAPPCPAGMTTTACLSRVV